jgi:hypothetical protein
MSLEKVPESGSPKTKRKKGDSSEPPRGERISTIRSCIREYEANISVCIGKINIARHLLKLHDQKYKATYDAILGKVTKITIKLSSVKEIRAARDRLVNDIQRHEEVLFNLNTRRRAKQKEYDAIAFIARF